jgi:hypothetical protein
VRVAFDSRPAADPRGGPCARGLLQALRDTAAAEDEVVETHRPRGADVFHAPGLQGAMLHSPCPMVVTLHDLAALERTSEQLRCGGMHLRLRHLAVQRAVHVIVSTEAAAHRATVTLGLDRERVTVIPAADAAAEGQDAAQSTWTWEDAARETWRVYRRALAQPHRPCVTVRRWPQGLGVRRSGRARIVAGGGPAPLPTTPHDQ